MSGSLATLRGLGVAYGEGQAALSDIDLDIAAGERLAVIGESGSGKSTLALALAGLLPDNARIMGDIAWEGGERPVPGRDIGFIFQDAGASLNPVLRVGEQVAEVAQRHLGLNWREACAYARDLLAQVQIPAPDTVLNAYAHQLSGGQRQRVAIAAAIAARPRLLIADEPTSALDTIVQSEIVALLERLVREAGMTLVFISHDIALVSGFADRIAVLHAARLVEAGPAADVLRAPKAAYTARLIASHIGLDTPRLIGASA